MDHWSLGWDPEMGMMEPFPVLSSELALDPFQSSCVAMPDRMSGMIFYSTPDTFYMFTTPAPDGATGTLGHFVA
ncbi:hypothetical protein VTN96DRAFT_296 [Rasamsonia emersonii]